LGKENKGSIMTLGTTYRIRRGGTMKDKIYGQHGEDRILKLIFKDQKAGLVIDVGAADGCSNSNSAALLERPSWKGILIEPESSQFKELQTRYKDQPKIICVRCAIGVNEGIGILHCGGQVSTFDEEVKLSAEINNNVVYETTEEVEIKTLTTLLDELEITDEIDFLSIDAEGMNYEVWNSLDDKKYSPKLVCIEGKGYYLEGYEHLCRTGCNTFYMREDICLKL
jgi:FkbM family methyltransferase